MRLRVMTYNTHGCVGIGGYDSTEDIAILCRETGADVIALQELDAPETDRDEGAHHARDLAHALGMELLFCRTFRRGVGFYGHALLSRHPVSLVKVTTFPAVPAPLREPRLPHLVRVLGGLEDGKPEPRGAIWGRVHLPEGRTLDVISTHLGVFRNERALQSRELVGHGWLKSPERKGPLVLCGDLNAVPRGRTYRRLATELRDAQLSLAGHAPKPTFPSTWPGPVVRLDHVFLTPDMRVRAVEVPSSSRARRASDHLPLVVDVELPNQASSASES